MKTQLLLSTTLFCLPILNFAQTQCNEIQDNALRLACYDRTNQHIEDSKNTLSSIPENKINKMPSWMENFQVRDQGLPRMASIAGPAIIGITHENGKDASVIKASAIYNGNPFSNHGNGWYPFSSLSIDRDVAANIPRNVWILQIGTRGTILDYTKTGIAFDTKLSLGRREDTQAKTSSNQALIDSQIVIKGLATGEPWPQNATTFQLVPIIGLSYDNQQKVKAGNLLGTYSSGYGGIALSLWPSSINKNLQISAQTRRFSDFNSSSNLNNRHVNYSTISIDYYLYEPREKSIFTPIIGITKEVGSDPINGITNSNRTTISLKFKIN